jgi:hypothetical protein
MAPKKDFFSELLSSSPNLFSQLLFGFILAGIALLAKASLPVSICLGVVGGSILGWITNANENSSQPQTVASNDGIDIAIKYWLFFMFGFLLLGYSAAISIFLGGLAGVGGGWIIAWWGSKEEARTQLPEEIFAEEETEESDERNTKQTKRKAPRRFRRTAGGGFNFRFWQKK